MLTTTQATRRVYLVIALMFAFLIAMVSISTAVIMWIAVLVVWILLWIGFWLRWGRYWHPIPAVPLRMGRLPTGDLQALVGVRGGVPPGMARE